MTVFRNRFRGGRWRYDFRAGGVRHQGYCVDPATGEEARSRADAEELEALVKRAVRRDAAAMSSVVRAGGFAFGRALRLHIESQTNSTPLHVANLELYARELIEHFGALTPVTDIDQLMVDAYRAKAAKMPVLIWKGGPRKKARMRPEQIARFMVPGDRVRSPASTNHYLDCLRAAFGAANRVRDPVSGRPMLPHPPDVKPLPVPRRQPRPMPDAELYARLEKAPPWTVDAAELARHFGLRRSEALRATVDHIDHEHRALFFPGTESKSGRDEFAAPIAGGWELLTRLERQAKARGARHLIAWPGPKWWRPFLEGKAVPAKAWRELKSVRRSWRTTAKVAEVTSPHRFHDVRARFITEVAKVDRGLAKDAARHADPKTTEGYVGVAVLEVAKAVRQVGRPNKGERRGAAGRPVASAGKRALRAAK